MNRTADKTKPKRMYAVTLTDEVAQLAELLGGGNRSAGIRKAVSQMASDRPDLLTNDGCAPRIQSSGG